MSWFRLDDQGAFHAKVLAAGNEAYGAWCRAGQWSSGYGTEGRIPRVVALQIGPDRIWSRLVSAGLCEPLDAGWMIHDFLDWNPSSEEVLAKRKVRAIAGSAGGKARSKRLAIARATAEQSLSVALCTPEANAKQNSTPSPSPSPEEKETPVIPLSAEPKRTRAKAKRPAAPEVPIPADFAVSEAIAAMCQAEGLPNPHDVLPDFRDWALSKNVKHADWEASFRRWMRDPRTTKRYPAWEREPEPDPQPEYGPPVENGSGIRELTQALLSPGQQSLESFLSPAKPQAG